MERKRNGQNLVWPELYLVRHGQSEYNILRAIKAKDELYQEFRREFELWDKRFKSAKSWLRELPNDRLVELAIQVSEKFSLNCSDADTLLTEEGKRQAQETGKALAKFIEVPDVVFCSPYTRTNQTFENVAMFCPQFDGVKVYQEDRIREQEHGLLTVYNDWRIYQVFHPEQKALSDRCGSYDVCHPNGENIARVRDRVRSWFDKLLREYAGKRVWAFSHHLTILTITGLHKHWDRRQFMWWDKYKVPPNLSVTSFKPRGDGKLILDQYGKVYY